MSRPNRTPIEGQIVDLLVDLVFHQLQLAEPLFAPPSSISWGWLGLSELTGRIAWEEEPLALVCDVPEAAFHRLMADEIRNQRATIRLRDESEVVGEIAHLSQLSFQGEARIGLRQWTWRGSERPSFWIGRLEGPVPPDGNLAIREKTPDEMVSRFDCYRLEGHYKWYLLRIDKSPARTVVVDPGDAPIDHDRLRRDLLSMQFAFGGPLHLSRLVGIDAERKPVGAVGPAAFVRQSGRRRAPVPDDVGVASVWVPAFFRAVSAKLNAEGLDPLLIAVSAYLDSVTEHLDGAYLKAQVGLEAFAKRMVTASTPKELLVKDGPAWKAWVSTLRVAISSHLKNAKTLEIVYGKFVAAMHAPTGNIVQQAFGESVVLPDDILDEVKKRNYPVHGFLMNAGINYEVDRDVRRVEMIQALLVALVARHVGYHGPLKGYDVRDDGGRHPPAWWPGKDLDGVAADQFVAERIR